MKTELLTNYGGMGIGLPTIYSVESGKKEHVLVLNARKNFIKCSQD